MTPIIQSIKTIRSAGFNLEIVKGRIAISPIDRLTDRQLDWLRRHKDEVLAALTTERVVVPKLRQVVRFRLRDGQGGGSALGLPGEPLETITEGLRARYGSRLASVDGFNIRQS